MEEPWGAQVGYFLGVFLLKGNLLERQGLSREESMVKESQLVAGLSADTEPPAAFPQPLLLRLFLQGLLVIKEEKG